MLKRWGCTCAGCVLPHWMMTHANRKFGVLQHVARYFHCYIMWYPLSAVVLNFQCTSHVYLNTPFISERRYAHFCSGLCIVVYGTGTLWDLWSWPIFASHRDTHRQETYSFKMDIVVSTSVERQSLCIHFLWFLVCPPGHNVTEQWINFHEIFRIGLTRHQKKCRIFLGRYGSPPPCMIWFIFFERN